jgi:hypothetical protein
MGSEGDGSLRTRHPRHPCQTSDRPPAHEPQIEGAGDPDAGSMWGHEFALPCTTHIQENAHTGQNALQAILDDAHLVLTGRPGVAEENMVSECATFTCNFTGTRPSSRAMTHLTATQLDLLPVSPAQDLPSTLEQAAPYAPLTLLRNAFPLTEFSQQPEQKNDRERNHQAQVWSVGNRTGAAYSQ